MISSIIIVSDILLKADTCIFAQSQILTTKVDRRAIRVKVSSTFVTDLKEK